MKNIIKGFLLSVAAITLFASCAQENFSAPKGKSLVFKATIADATRTTIDADGTVGKVNWVAGDEITINGVAYVATPDADDATKATFTKKDDTAADPEPVNGKYYAAYGVTFTASKATGTLPKSQTYSATGANAPMYAESETTLLSFKNICGLLEINLKGTETVSSIRVSSSNLAESGTFSVSEGQSAVLEDMGPDYKYPVNLNCGDGVTLSAEGTKFYVAIPAGNYESLKIDVTAADGKSWSKTAVNTASVEANNIYSLSFTPEFADHFVAKIGETGYNTLAEAFAAAGETPVTITILEDCIADKIETAATNDITLDLNGKAIDTYISNYGKLTINDSSADKSGIFKTQRGYDQNLYLRDGSETIINAGTIVGPVTENAAVKVQKNSITTINGGTIRGTYAIYFDSASANVTVNGGTLKGETGVVDLYAAGILTIKDGYFNGPEIFTGNKKTANTVTEGGYYTVEPNFASTGYAPKQLTSPVTEDGVTYNYIIAEYNTMMSVAGVEYESVADAVAAINNSTSDVTVKFLQNISLEQEIVINNANAKVTLDLNGKTVRAQNASSVSAVVVEGASTVVDFIDSVGGGMFDHTYANTGYTLTVKSGTANLISGNISNMTSSGYGRVAVRVLATDAPAYFNMTGGVVRGGRAIRIGGASEDARAYLTISGGLVEGRNTDSGNYYTAVSVEKDFSTILINGGTIKGNGTKSVVYCTSNLVSTSITITKNEISGTIPYIFSNGCKYAVAAATSSDYGGTIYNCAAWNYYTDNSSTSWVGTAPVKTELETPVTDGYGNTYTYYCTPKN